MSNKITHNAWEEDGKKYSSWTIETGRHMMRTNDAGKVLFDKALQEAARGLSLVDKMKPLQTIYNLKMMKQVKKNYKRYGK